MKKNVRIVLVAILGIIILASLYIYINRPVEVESYVVSKHDITETFIVDGSVLDNDVTIYSKVQGLLDAIFVEEGQVVKEGDIICKINSSDYVLGIEQAKSAIAGYIAQKKNLDLQDDLQDITLSKNISDVEFAQKNADNFEVLYQAGAISKSEYDNVMQALINAKTALSLSLQKSYKEDTNSASKASKEYYDALISVQQSNINLYIDKIKDCEIKATSSGIITSLGVKDMNFINLTTPLATIKIDSPREIETYILTKNYNNVNIGDEVTLTQAQDTDEVVFKGKVVDIDSEAVSKMSSLGITEKNVKVTVLPGENEKAVLLSGFSVDVEFTSYKSENQITVPKTAVFKSNNTGKDMIFVIKNKKAVLKEVKLGKELRNDYVVADGVEEGDIIIENADVEGLKENVNVK